MKSGKLIKNASSKIVYYIIKNTAEQNRWRRTEQTTKFLRAQRVPISVKFLATANELRQKNSPDALQKNSVHWELVQNLLKWNENSKNSNT